MTVAVGMMQPQCVKGATYAYSIGVNHGTGDGKYDGDFTPNVINAKNAYARINNMVSNQLLKPTFTLMYSSNPNGNRIIASKVVFLNGHSTYAKMTFNHNNIGNDYNTGVTNSHDGNNCAGLLSVDMSTCKVISFVGCQTGNIDYASNLVRTAVARGANTAVGFKEDITSRSSTGQNWLKKYNNALANGSTVSESLRAAVNSYPNCDMSSNVIIAGRPTQTVASVGTSSAVCAESNVNQPVYTANIDVSEIPDSIKEDATDEVYASVIERIKEVDDSFDASDYKVSVNRYDADHNSGVMIFIYCMNGIIETNKAYVCTINNNVITDITGPAMNTAEVMRTREVIPTEKQLCSLAMEHQEEKSVELMENAQGVVSESNARMVEGYNYDYYTNKLIYEKTIYRKDQEGIIYDQYYSVELY